ncbi:hypothetical protein UP09_30995 [Bradyrhizobium sp. LTSP885]|uniref:hypothetical protein n=1 Tax=Bradyrhizobium sp. LTSP885 TaxID=1619232 RepID=UPI0005C9AF46|nr:hypothetical protein [Bradyrhizobium sp. LTSP885]KJC35653.1 hypothetical protein UP09_30995 [Bradyrhizobium sp. LTSP885]
MNALALRAFENEWYQSANNPSELARSSTKPVVLARPQLSSPSVVHRSNWARPTIDRLSALAPLGDNWDQRGSAAVRADVLQFAWNILVQIMPYDGKPPVIVPLGNGGVQLEWSTSAAALEIEVSRPFEVSALLVTEPGGEETENELPTDTWDRLTETVREYFRQ